MLENNNTYRNSQFKLWINDPVFGDDFSGLTDQEMRDISQVSDSVNRKISLLVDTPPFFFRHFGWIALSTLTIAIILGATLFIQNEKSDKPHIALRLDSGIVNTQEDDFNDEINSFNSAKNNEEISGRLNSDNNNKNQDYFIAKDSSGKERKQSGIPTTEKNTSGGPEPHTDPVKTNSQHDDTRNFVQDDNKMVFLRVADVQVLSKVNASDNQSPKSNNNDVTNPNIGGSVVKKTKNNEYSIDDMPYYTGGDQGFVSYLVRNLSNKIYIPKKEAVFAVNAMFEVTSKGSVTNVQIPGNIPESIKKVVSKVISDSVWNAGKKSGKKGSVEVSVVIHFYF